jgi:hypothetical protein
VDKKKKTKAKKQSEDSIHKDNIPDTLERNVFVGLEEDAMQDEVDVSAWQKLDCD